MGWVSGCVLGWQKRKKGRKKKKKKKEEKEKKKNYFLDFKIFKNKTVRDTMRSDSVSHFSIPNSFLTILVLK